jgi:hypothetical protein
MQQSRLATLFESVGGTAVGFVVALALQYGVCWWYALPLRLADNLGIIAVFTVASVVRGYGWRRLCEALSIRRPLSAFMRAVIAERLRQQEVEGWSAEHDDNEHSAGDMALAGATYAKHAVDHLDNCVHRLPPPDWPWEQAWWKPADFRRDLVKGAALIIAEGESHDRRRRRRLSAAPGKVVS